MKEQIINGVNWAPWTNIFLAITAFVVLDKLAGLSIVGVFKVLAAEAKDLATLNFNRGALNALGVVVFAAFLAATFLSPQLSDLVKMAFAAKAATSPDGADTIPMYASSGLLLALIIVSVLSVKK